MAEENGLAGTNEDSNSNHVIHNDFPNPEDELLEKEHFHKIINAFHFYRVHSLKRVETSEKSYHSLAERHKDLIPAFLDQLDIVRSCIDHNQQIIKLIIDNTDQIFENKDHALNENGEITSQHACPTALEMDMVRSTLKQFARDWSECGRAERAACYDPVIAEVRQRFPLDSCDPSNVCILVPGAGLGRLAYELATLGYSCQGNEWSLFMLFASNFVLNKCRQVNAFTLYPWVHNWVNLKSSDHQTKAITFPDVNPSDLTSNTNFSMAAGDFLEVYTETDCWDCVATVFFIDTAHNVIAYIETMWKILKPGGYWINMGPLLYHFADMTKESSIELSYEDIRSVIVKFGFQFEKEELDVKATYTQSLNSMLTYQYNCVFFVVRKPPL